MRDTPSSCLCLSAGFGGGYGGYGRGGGVVVVVVVVFLVDGVFTSLHSAPKASSVGLVGRKLLYASPRVVDPSFIGQAKRSRAKPRHAAGCAAADAARVGSGPQQDRCSLAVYHTPRIVISEWGTSENRLFAWYSTSNVMSFENRVAE